MARKKKIGEVVAGLREAKGWTVYRLAKEAGLDPTAVYRIESGKQAMSAAALLAITEAMGVSLAAFDGCARPPKRPKKSPKKSAE